MNDNDDQPDIGLVAAVVMLLVFLAFLGAIALRSF